MIVKMKSSSIDAFVDSYINKCINDTLNKYSTNFMRECEPRKRSANKNTNGNEQQKPFGNRFCDELPQDDKRICVKMKIDGRTIMLIGKYCKDKHVILNGYIGGIFGLDDNDEWLYTSDLKD